MAKRIQIEKKENKKKPQEKISKKREDFLKRNAIHGKKKKENNEAIQEEILKKEKEECTFKPKISKFIQNPDRQKLNLTNYFSKQRDENSFYERNVNWKKEIQDKSFELNKENENKEGEKVKKITFTPKILKKVDMDKVFHNKKTFDYWLKNNKPYIIKKKKLLLEAENEEKLERFPYLTYKKKRCNSVETSKPLPTSTAATTPAHIRKEENLNKSIDILHYELSQTAYDDEE